MKLSIFTTVTNPDKRGDNYKDALACYKDLADEVVIIYGHNTVKNGLVEGADEKALHIATLTESWPQEFNWKIIGEHFQKGYEVATGDVVIRADIDYIFHEDDFDNLRKACKQMLNAKIPALSMWKYQFILPDRYNLKSRIVNIVNKRDFGDRIVFNSGGDLCQPSLDGEYINPNYTQEAKVPVYNYEKILKTKQQIADDQGRMERAYFRHFGNYQMKSGGTDENAYAVWIATQVNKFSKPQKIIGLTQHPRYIQETIKNLKPENFGYNGHGYLQENKYI